ncbi:hypothetical protein GQ55_5G219600 [Panicum hallii var. hallii]|uniref:Uncharacterized protein n=1 Tax=Panicum hallii var. hallii TaxID=1504633 RepID=A0A2T7DIW9_9POAL|nr:hypothetical protein GQ55_5G219600 [Panicum hallii var. hallii]
MGSLPCRGASWRAGVCLPAADPAASPLPSLPTAGESPGSRRTTAAALLPAVDQQSSSTRCSSKTKGPSTPLQQLPPPAASTGTGWPVTATGMALVHALNHQALLFWVTYWIIWVTIIMGQCNPKLQNNLHGLYGSITG